MKLSGNVHIHQSTLINTIILAIFILVSYLAKHVVVLYQQYHMADRLDAYLGDLEEVITCTDMLQKGVVGLGELFSIVQRPVRGSLSMTVTRSEESESYTNHVEFIIFLT